MIAAFDGSHGWFWRNRSGAPVTITLRKVMVGTELSIVQEGIPEVIPVEACYLGWQESLTLLAQLVQPEIPDQ